MTFNSVMNFSENGRTFHDCLGCCHLFQYYMSSIFVFIICACVVDPHWVLNSYSLLPNSDKFGKHLHIKLAQRIFLFCSLLTCSL